MSEPVWDRAEAILTKARTTLGRAPGTPLRDAMIAIDQYELISSLEETLEFSKGQDQEHTQLVRLASLVRAGLIAGSNGARFWTPSLPRAAKTALTLLNNYLRRAR